MSAEKYGKLINLKPFNDDKGTIDNSQQKFVKQLQDITDDEGLRLAYEKKMVCINVILNYLLQALKTFQ